MAGLPASYRRLRLILQLKAVAAVTLVLLCLATLAFAAFPVLLPVLLVGYPILEVAFAVWFWGRLRGLNANLYSALPENHDGYTVFRRFIDSQATLSAYLDIEALLTRWFGGAPFHEIKRENVLDLLAYGFLYKRRDQLVSEGKGPLLEDMADSLERAWSITFPPGRTPNLRFHAHLWEPLRFHYRPLLLYIIFELLMWLEQAVLLCCGFRAHTAHGIKYYSYGLMAGSAGAPCSVPMDRNAVVFLHGVGLGLLPYIPFLIRLAACKQPIIAFEFQHLSMRLCIRDIPRIEDLMSGVISALDLHNTRHVSIIGHSYGTLLASRFVQRFPTRMAGLCLIDPVCFCMFSGDLIQNFLYKAPKEISQLVTWFVSREFHTSAAVSRHFFWTMLNLWPEDLPSRSLVVLSENDQLIPVPSVHLMLRSTDAVVLKHPSHAHADFLGDTAWQDELLAEFLRMLGVVHSRSDSASSYLQLSSGYAKNA